MDNFDNRKIKSAFISVFDKSGLLSMAAVLSHLGVEFYSTGGTKKELATLLPVKDVSDLTGFPELFDGRLKTLHPLVHGGLLFERDNEEHVAAAKTHGIKPIDLLIVNLYPFEQTVQKGASFEQCIENIDIGGPAMIRAAAKNHRDVVVIIEPADYDALLAELKQHSGATSLRFRKKMAAKAYARTAAYDAAISNWFYVQNGETTPKYRAFGGTLIQPLRYGENPHQTAAFYKTPEMRFGVATATQLQGKELSYNNINDTDAAYECVAEFNPGYDAAVAIIKHANPCGVATGETLLEAYHRALRCDRTSAFGGIVALNRILDAEAARAMVEIFTEVIIAPDATPEAIEIIGQKKNLRLLLAGGLPNPRAPGLVAKTLAGGMLVQTRDNKCENDISFSIVTKRDPTPEESRDLRFAWKVAKHVKSNAIVFAKDAATVGVGAGQMSRLDSAHIAVKKGRDMARNEKPFDVPPLVGSVAASDAFFPFTDALLACIEAGATAVVQPGGSKNDNEVIKLADDHNVAMVFTGVRHFRH